MALDSISRVAVGLQDASRVTQKVNSTAQNNNTGQVAVTGATETHAAPKVFTSNNNMGETEQQNGDDKKNAEKIKNALNQANTKLKHARTRCEFAYNDEVNRVSIKVLDRDTDEVIREIPPEEALEMVEKLWELAGLLVDEKR